jgi:hypothetical protein
MTVRRQRPTERRSIGRRRDFERTDAGERSRRTRRGLHKAAPQVRTLKLPVGKPGGRRIDAVRDHESIAPDQGR